MRWLGLLALLGIIWITATPVYADTAEVTVRAAPLYVVPGTPSPPVDFRVTYVDDYRVLIEWTKGASANNTMIRASYNTYPTSVSDGYEVYYGQGNTANDTAVNWYEHAGTVYYWAVSDNWTGAGPVYYSTAYVTASLENPVMVDIARQLVSFNSLFSELQETGLVVVGLLVLMILSALGFWRPKAVLSSVVWMITGGVSVTLGLYWYDIYTNDMGLPVSLMLIVFWLVCWGYAFAQLFASGKEGE